MNDCDVREGCGRNCCEAVLIIFDGMGAGRAYASVPYAELMP